MIGVTALNIGENLSSVRERIKKAAIESGRDEKEITLIAVTKTYPIEAMNEAIDHGVTDIGENRPQEVRDKFEFVKPVRWHLIGQLQSNKIKYVIDKCAMIHSVDSIKLMSEIEKQAQSHDIDIDILIQVNISGEESKSGVRADELDDLLKYAAKLERVHVKGLMTIAPKAEYGDPEIHFRNMKQLFDSVKEKEYDNVAMDELSMGMSGDFEAAIRCGSTMVRIGSAIFGERKKKI